MSSTNPPARKGKKERACDGCRRRKTKCDGPWMQQNICTNCIQARKACTYVEASKPRGPPKAYVTGLEDRLETLETLLQQICPDTDFSEELGPPVIRGSWKAHLEPTNIPTSPTGTAPTSILIPFQPKDIPISNHLVSPSRCTTHLRFLRSKRSRPNAEAISTLCASGYYLSDDDSTTDASSSSSDTKGMLISSRHGRIKISLLANEPDDPPDENAIRIHSTSSTARLIDAARKFKQMHLRETMNPDPSVPSSPDNFTMAQSRRPQFWVTPPWESFYESNSVDPPTVLPKLLLHFPPTDLAETLFSLYFARSNSVFPLLHRPTFERQWRDGLHHRNIWFACVCACLFAVASPWCNDERVLSERSQRENEELDWRKAGRQYFEVGVEIHRIRKNIFQPASLFEVQSFALLSMYLRSTNAFPVAWLLVSVGIRKAQDAGAHRKKIYRGDPNADDELWKRAFWHLVAFDRIGSVALGRSCIAEEDFDLDLPLEVDDEYWEGRQNTDKIFDQPPSIPSRIAAFNHFIKLTRIMAFTMRTMYAIDNSKTHRGILPIGTGNVPQLLSAMEEWLETIPEHLKWRDNMNNLELSIQSANLLTSYYLTLMLIHRPLITTSPPSPSTKSCSSGLSPRMLSDAIVICTDAARSCARIIEVQVRDGLDNFHIPTVINVAYVCAGLLSYRIWNLKVQEKAQQCECSQDVKPTISQRIEHLMADAHIFMKALEQAKRRWNIVDSMLEELSASLPGPQSQGPSTPDSTRSNNASHLGPTSDDHPHSLPHAGYPMDIQYRQWPTAQQLKDNQHVLDFRSLSDTEHLACLQLSQNVSTHPPITNESRLHSHSSDANLNQSHPISRRSCPLSTAAPPYIPDEHSLFYTTNALRRTSFPNFHARESHDGHQPTHMEYPTSLSTPAGSSFSTGGSTAKYHDTNMDFGDEASIHHRHHDPHQTSSQAIQKSPLSMYDKRGYSRLERKSLPARAMGPDGSTSHQGWSATPVMPPDPYIHAICDPPYDESRQDYSHSQGLYHPYSSSSF